MRLLTLFRSPASSEVPLMLEFGSNKYILKEDFYTQSNASPVEDGSVDVSAISERRFDPQNEESSLSFEVSPLLNIAVSFINDYHRSNAEIFLRMLRGRRFGKNAKTSFTIEPNHYLERTIYIKNKSSDSEVAKTMHQEVKLD